MRIPLAIGLLSVLLTNPSWSQTVTVYAQNDPAGSLPNMKPLMYPAQAEPFSRTRPSRMFKPDGEGPFPAVVILPTCGAHDFSTHAFDWAQKALDRGYAVLLVDPLYERGAGPENCRARPPKVSWVRYRKDGFDAAEHLRKQAFVKRDRIGLIGFSMGAMAGLGASGEPYMREDGRMPFRAIVSNYPRCSRVVAKQSGGAVLVRWLPVLVRVPLLVQMGELDTDTPAKDCVPLLEVQKRSGAPVDFVVYKNATHAWDASEIGSGRISINSLGQQIENRYNREVTQESVIRAFEFLDHQLKTAN